MSNSTISVMLIDAQNQIDQLDSTISSIDDQISIFQEKQDALKEVCDSISTNLENYIIGTKFSPAEDYTMNKGVTYNLSEDDLGTITDWKIYSKFFELDSTCISTSQVFSLEGDYTSIFYTEKLLSFFYNNEYSFTSVNKSEFNEETNTTEITLNDAILSSNDFVIFEVCYEYIESDDENIDNYKTQWDFTHDYIIHPFESTGTYGTKANIEQLTSAKNLITANKTKIYESTSVLEPFK